MTNREKYAKEILDIACSGNEMGLRDGKPCSCADMNCNQCDFFDSPLFCKDSCKLWSESEYEEK